MLLDIGVRISNSSTVVGHNVGNLVGSHSLSFDTAELELSFLGIDLVSLESTFHVVKDSEELASSLNGDNVHDAEGESGFSSDLAVDLDQTFLVFNDLHCLLTGESISQSISKEHRERDAFLSLMGSSGGSGGVNSS